MKKDEHRSYEKEIGDESVTSAGSHRYLEKQLFGAFDISRADTDVHQYVIDTDALAIAAPNAFENQVDVSFTSTLTDAA
jgi:hypothetical protein